MRRIFEIVVALVMAGLVAASPRDAHAQKVSLLRDAEIENTIRQFAAPVFLAAKLNPQSVNIHLVQDNTLNAFVAGGQRLFINSGLLIRSKNAEQVIGVIAHETGHIAGGHLTRVHGALEDSAAATILSMVLGGIAIGAGRGDVGSAIIAGGQGMAQRSFFSFSRTQESAADQAALRYLDATGLPASGLLEFMEVLSDQELMTPERQDPYVRTHPLTRERIDAIAEHIKRSSNADARLPPEFALLHARMRAKLYGYLYPVAQTLREYGEDGNSVPARYARALAFYRKPDLGKALPLIDGLIADHPRDPYFRELKGQMLFENGDAHGALAPYQAAVDLLPDNGLIRVDLARVQIALNDPDLLAPAVANLRAALVQEMKSPFAWRQLAIAYGHQGDKARSALALAEEALLLGRKSEARYHAGFAVEQFPKGSREWLQAQDILIAARVKKQ